MQEANIRATGHAGKGQSDPGDIQHFHFIGADLQVGKMQIHT